MILWLVEGSGGYAAKFSLPRDFFPTCMVLCCELHETTSWWEHECDWAGELKRKEAWII